MTSEQHGASENEGWRAVVAAGLERLGWSQGARIDRPAEDVTLVIIDAPLAKDIVLELAGPTTFSLSVFLEGAGKLAVDGLDPVEFGSGSAVLFACRGYASGVDTLRGGQHFRVVDMRFEESFLHRAGGPDLGPSGVRSAQVGTSGSGQVFLACFPASPHLLQVASEIVESAGADTLARRLVLQGKDIEALGAAVEALDRSARQPPTSPLRPQERVKVARARALLEDRYDEAWTIRRLAREVGLGEKLLKAGFRDIVGSPVHAYLTDLRLARAARLLDEGVSVTNTALAVGFGNLSHFSKVFRQAKGLSPSLYARRR